MHPARDYRPWVALMVLAGGVAYLINARLQNTWATQTGIFLLLASLANAYAMARRYRR